VSTGLLLDGLAAHQRELSPTARAFNVAVVALPFLALPLVVVQLWGGLVGALDLALFAVMYVLSTIGVTMGFHRLLTHRSFQTYPWIRNLLAALGSMAVQGPPIVWVADHRKHHTFADVEGDPHSPHVPAGAWRGLAHAHAGWLLHRTQPSDPLRYARDLLKEPTLRRMSSCFPLLVIAGIGAPAAVGLAVEGTLQGALDGALWGGLVRIFFVHHVTWSINSICHHSGRRRFATADRSRNVIALALPSFGEAWHHNHHAFPRSARHGLRWWEIDLTGALIELMARLGLAWDVVSVDRETQRRRELTRAA
jgi:stearoyl-CoA desaturase (delta-9 desaturase)